MDTRNLLLVVLVAVLLLSATYSAVPRPNITRHQFFSSELTGPVVIGVNKSNTIWCSARNRVTFEGLIKKLRQLFWVYNSEKLVPAVDRGLSSDFDVYMERFAGSSYVDNATWRRVLHFKRAQPSSAGNYTCVARYQGHIDSRQSVEIRVSDIDCGDPGTPTNGDRHPFSTVYTSEVLYYCSTGYTLQGPDRRTCQSDGEWSGYLPQCNPTDCGDPGTPTNGQRSLSSTTYNSVVTYTCDVGYTLLGSNSRTCQSDGQWSGSVPQCKKVPSQVTGISLSKAVWSRLPALRANWIIPQSDKPISKYILQYRIHGTTSWDSQHTISGSPPPNSTIVSRLAVGTEYDVRVRALSAVGAGMWSAVQTERTYMKPPSPNHHTVSAIPVDRRGVIRVSWTAPTVPRGELPITGYSIRYKVQNSNSFKHTSVNSTYVAVMIADLNPGTVYRVYVAGVSAIGPGSLCCEGIPVLVSTYNVPSQVSGVAVSMAIRSGKPALSVTWIAPQSDVPISQYQVEYRKSGTNWRAASPVSPGSTTSTLLEALDAGTVYEVRIRAVSAIGNGAWSRVESETTYRRVPSQVTGLSLSKAVSSRIPTLLATWTTPQSDEPISQYILQYRKHGTTSWGSQHSISGSPPQNSTFVPRLAAGTEYDVRVRAVSAVGAGNWSAVQTERTFMKPPSPSHDTVSAVPVNRHGVIRVSWTAPTVPRGELPITGYTIWYKVQNSNMFKYWTVMSNSETEVTGLNPGTIYRVYVAGVSAIGRGSYCCEGTSVLVRTYNVPSQVSGVEVSNAMHSGKPVLRVTWTTPQSDVTISQYQVEYRRSGTNWRAVSPVSPGSTTSTLLEALDAGTVYEVRIRAVSAIGTGPWSEVESQTTYTTNPQPIVLLVNSTLQGLSISWSVTSPQDVTNYMVFWWKESAEISKSVALDDTKFVIEGLLSNTAYHVVVLASGPLGRVNSTTELFYTPPKQIQGSLSVLVLPAQVLQVSWKPPGDVGQSTIEYIVNVTTAGMDFINLTSIKHPITSVPISGLPQYNSGTVSVWVKNPGATSKPVVSRFRMVNIVTNVSGVSAEWVDESFTSLRVSLPGGSTYRITYTSVNESNATEPKTVTTNLISHVVEDFRHDWFYTVLVEEVTLDSDEAMNGSMVVGGNNAATVVSFFGGLVTGGVCVILVVGIVLGLVKLRKQRKGAESIEEEEKTEATYETVGPKESAALSEHVAMETNPAYASVH